MGGDSQRRPWSFLTSHARVLILISQNPNIQVRDVAEMAGIIERSAQRIMVELEEAGYLTDEKVGRRNRYMLGTDTTLCHPLEQAVELRFLLDIFRHAPQESGVDTNDISFVSTPDS